MSALGLLSPGECLWKTKLEELDSQIRSLSPDTSDSERDRIKSCAYESIKLLEGYRPKEEDSISSLLDRCQELESSLTHLELTCLKADKDHYFSKASRKPQNRVIKKIHVIMSEVLFHIATYRIQNVKKRAMIADSLSKTPHLELMQIAITSTKDYQSTHLERKLELLSRTLDLLIIIPEKRRTLDVFMLYAKATCCMTKADFKKMLALIQQIKNKDRLEICYICIALFDLNPSLGIEGRKIKLLKNIEEKGVIFFKVFSSGIDTLGIHLLKKAKINFDLVDSLGQTIIHSFAQNGNLEMISWLIKQKANPSIRSIYGITPYMELRMRGFPIPREIPSDDFGYYLKMASLIWGLKGVVVLDDGIGFDFEAGSITISLSEDVIDIPHLHLSVKRAFSLVVSNRLIHKVISDIHNGLITVIPAGYYKHSIILVFYQDLLFICNRGEGASTKKCLVCFRIDPKKVNGRLIQSIFDCKNTLKDQALLFYYQNLPLSLSLERVITDLTSEFYALQPKLQKVGNCAAANLKLSIRACLAAISFKENDDFLSEEISRLLLLQSKEATRFLRENSYKRLKNELTMVSTKVAERILAHFETKRIKYGIQR